MTKIQVNSQGKAYISNGKALIASDSSSITATNKTGSVISKDDKVWVKPLGDISGKVFEHNSSNYNSNFISGISNDGNYFTHATSNISTDTTTYPLWFINDLQTDQVTSLGNNLIKTHAVGASCYRYSNQGHTFINIPINSSSTGGCSKVGDDTFILNYQRIFIGYDYVSSCATSSAANSLKIIDLKTGSDLSSISTSLYGFGRNGIAVTSTDIYSFGSSSTKRKHIVVDRTNLTATSSNVTDTGVTCYCPIGATSDGKVVIVADNFDMRGDNSESSKKMQFVKVSGNTETAYTINEYPEDLKAIINNTTDVYFFCFNPICNVFTYAKFTGSANDIDYGFYQYSTSNETWNKLNIDLTDVIGSGNWLGGVITVSGDLKRIGIPVSSDSSYTYRSKLRIVQLQSTSGYNLIPYKYYSIGSDVSTGIAKENIAVNSSGSVSIAGA